MKTSPLSKQLLSVFLLLTSIVTYSQVTGTASSLIKAYAVKSPDAASMEKHLEVPVTQYTGQANISIPLYTVASGDLNVPISISYHTSGIRIEEEASSVGLGWSLSAGGMISRTIRGSDDLIPQKGSLFNSDLSVLRSASPSNVSGGNTSSFNSDNSFWVQKDNYTLFGVTGLNSSPNFNQSLYSATFRLNQATSSTCNTTEEYDGEPDLYSFSFPGHSGKFVITNEYENSNEYKVYLINQEDKLVKFVNNDKTGESGFEITTSDGFKYYFKHKEIQQTKTGRFQVGKVNEPTYFAENNYEPQQCAKKHISAWHLTSMLSPKGDSIIFHYKTINVQDLNEANNALPSRVQTITINTVPAGNMGSTPMDPNERAFSWRLTETRTWPAILENITFENGYVEFQNEPRIDLRGQNASRLKSILVRTDSSNVTEQYDFLYGYFDSQSNSPDYISKRLRLDQIIKKGANNVANPPYRFSYNTNNGILPDKNSYAQDFWGFYNGKNNNDIVPAGTSFPPLKHTLIPATISFMQLEAADRTPEEQMMKIGTLSKITYPTGGIHEYITEAHRFNNFVFQPNGYVGLVPTPFTISIGGGLRIKSIIIRDSTTLQESIKKSYVYSGGKLMYGMDFVYNDVTAIGGVDGPLVASSATRRPGSNSAQGHPVGYDFVTEYYEGIVDNGKIDYSFVNNPETRGAIFCYPNPGDCWPPGSGACGLFNNNVNCEGVQFFTPSSQRIVLEQVPNFAFNSNGLLKTTKTYAFKNGNYQISSEKNNYYSLTPANFWSNVSRVRIKCFVACRSQFNGGNGTPMVAAYYQDSEWIRPDSTQEIQYDAEDDNRKIVNVTQNMYQDLYNYKVLTSQKKLNSKNELVEMRQIYPQNMAGPVYSEMVNRYMVGVPVQEELYTSGTFNQGTLKEFKLLNTGSIVVEKVKYKRQGMINFEDYSIVLAYDIRNNPTQIKDINGIITSLDFWTSLGKKDLVKSKTVANQTVQYDYFPLIGLKEQTDPNGRKATYEYDAFNRLARVKDHLGRTLKEYCYNFAGQTVPCSLGAFSGAVAISSKQLLEDSSPCTDNIVRSGTVTSGQVAKDFACLQITIQTGFVIAPGGEYEGEVK